MGLDDFTSSKKMVRRRNYLNMVLDDYSQYIINLEPCVHLKALPKLKNWEIKAFLQPITKIEKMKKGLNGPQIFCALVLKSGEIKFVSLNPNEQKKKLDVVAFKRLVNVLQQQHFIGACVHIMQDLINKK